MVAPRDPARSSGLAAGLAALAIACGGCKGCRDDHPYVPYAIEDAPPVAPSTDDAVAPLPAPLDAGPFRVREATAAPANATRWTLDGVDLVAPADRVFALGLTGDFDGDGAKDAVALLLSPASAPASPGGDADGGVDLGELFLYRGRPGSTLGPAQVMASPPGLASGAGCAAKRRLTQVGEHSLALETGAACDRASGVRWVAVLGVTADATKAHFQATVLDPVAAPALGFDIDGSDRDGDGLDDVTVRVSLDGGGPPFEPGPRVTAALRWFDRSAGMSRDPDEPEASFRGIASGAAVRAAKPKEALAVPRLVEQARNLFRAVCAEGGGPRIVDVGGMQGPAGTIRCGTSKALEEVDLAEVRAYAVGGDPLRAIAALDRAQVAPASKTTTRTADAQGWIAQAAPTLASPSVLRAIGAVPQIDRGRSPVWGAVAFDANGRALVRTVAGVVRVDPVSGDEAAAPDVAVWRSALVSPDTAYRWLESRDECDGVSLHAVFAPNAGGDLRDVALPIAPPLGARCADPSHGEPATTLPIAWGPGGLEAVVAGEPLLVSGDLTRATPLVAPLGQPVTAGAPRSPNGKVLVFPTSLGILVRGARSRLLRAKELDGGYAELRDCAVSDDGARVACVRGGRAFVGVWEPE
jgi:hypothetical protein